MVSELRENSRIPKFESRRNVPLSIARVPSFAPHHNNDRLLCIAAAVYCHLAILSAEVPGISEVGMRTVSRGMKSAFSA